MKLSIAASAGTIFLLLIMLQQHNAAASSLSSYGSEFYLAFPRNVNGATNLTLTVHTLKSTSVQYSIESLNQDFSYSGTTTAGDPDVVAIPLTYEVLLSSYLYRKLGLHITSLETEPVSVVAWNENIHGYFSFLGLPCHTQPTNQYVYYAVSSHGFSNFPGYILLVGCMNNTNVTVIPTQYANITMPINPQSPINVYKTYRVAESNTFVIHAGQTFKMYQAFTDLSGTKIISDAPLTVISGHTAAQIPLGTADADPVATQVPPTITWGKEFLLSPHHNRDSGQFYKVIAHMNGTNIQRKCGTSPTVNATLSSGQVYQFNTSYTSYCSFIANRPIYVGHVGPSTFFNGGTYGDPTLNTVPPINQYLHSIEYTSFFTALSGVNLVIPNDQYFSNSLILDNILYSTSWDSTIYFPNGTVAGYGFYASTSGTHIFTHPNSLGGLFLSVYGWQKYKGFAFSGGMGLNPVNSQIVLPQISFTQELFIITEGDGDVVIYLNRSVNLEEEVSVRVSVTPQKVDTAEDGADYLSTSAVVTFRYGETLHNVMIAIIDDLYAEPIEYFSVRLEAVGQDVIVFPLTECTVGIHDNDYIQIGFSDTSLTIDSTELTLDVSNYHGIMQSGEISTVQLQVETLSGAILNITRFDFYNYSGSYIATLNLSHLPFFLVYNQNDAILIGRLAIDKSSINVTIEPSVISAIYNPQIKTSSCATSSYATSSCATSSYATSSYATSSYATSSYTASTTPVDCMTSEVFFISTVYITPTPTISSQACVFSQPVTVRSISIVYTSTIVTTLFTGSSCECRPSMSASLVTGKPSTALFTGKPSTALFTGKPSTALFTGKPSTTLFTGSTCECRPSKSASLFTGKPSTTLSTGKPSTTSTSIMNTSPLISKITITVEKSPSCSAVLPTTQPNQSSMNSTVVVGGVMGYFIFFILCIVSTVGGFFCGRSGTKKQRMTMSAINPAVVRSVNDYEGRRNAVRSSILNKNQSMPLPLPPRQINNNNGEEMYDDTTIYMEMDNLQEEKKYENSGAIGAM